MEVLGVLGLNTSEIDLCQQCRYSLKVSHLSNIACLHKFWALSPRNLTEHEQIGSWPKTLALGHCHLALKFTTLIPLAQCASSPSYPAPASCEWAYGNYVPSFHQKEAVMSQDSKGSICPVRAWQPTKLQTAPENINLLIHAGSLSEHRTQELFGSGFLAHCF